MSERPEPAQYLKVAWKHDFPDDPILLYHEIDADRWELRKVEVFADGRMDRADADSGTGVTRLSEKPLPPLDEIRAQREFEAEVISQADFESIWREAHSRSG
jgi:hypothetical protein